MLSYDLCEIFKNTYFLITPQNQTTLLRKQISTSNITKIVTRVFMGLELSYHFFSKSKGHILNKLRVSFKLIILIFWIKFGQNVYFQSKTGIMNTTIEFWIFEFLKQISLWENNFRFFDQIWPRKIFMVKNRKKWPSSLKSAYSN